MFISHASRLDWPRPRVLPRGQGELLKLLWKSLLLEYSSDGLLVDFGLCSELEPSG